jgi:hypothetical protein
LVWIALSKGARTAAFASPSLIADWFKYRNKIGLDVVIEALKDCLRQKKASIDEVYRYAKGERSRLSSPKPLSAPETRAISPSASFANATSRKLGARQQLAARKEVSATLYRRDHFVLCENV